MNNNKVTFKVPLMFSGLAAMVVLSTTGCTVSVSDNNEVTPNSTILPTTGAVSLTLTVTGSVSEAKLKDGTYTAEGSYFTPGGTEKIGVTITISNETITSVSIEQKPAASDSRRYQSLFANGINSEVVGKNIKDINVGRVNGSSLTGKGFNAALDIIEALAK